MATPPPVDKQTFLTHLRASGLVSAEQLQTLCDQLPQSNRGRVVARALVEQGVLTRFQAERLLAGRTNGFVLGQYRILDELGQGGMGRVFKAVHQTLDRVVALKVLAPQFVDTQRAQLLFQHEMRAVAQLTHPNLVTAYDANQIGDRSYLVMEYVAGPNLDQLVRERGPLPVGLACEIVRQAAEGLQYAWEMGLVHRDVKPSNVLVHLPANASARKQCTVKILDFGLARLRRTDEGDPDSVPNLSRRSNTILGTPDFVSPEQAHDLRAVDIRSDLYSLGCTFYYILSGRVPFPGGSTLEKLIRHRSEEPVPVDRLRPRVPLQVSGIVQRLLAKDPVERFQTPVELAAALESFAAPEQASWILSTVTATPAAVQSPNLLSREPSSPNDVMAALKSTVPPDLSPTPLSSTHSALLTLSGQMTAREWNQAKIAISVAIGVMTGLFAMLSWFSLR